MGAWASRTSPPDVDLLPPKFARRNDPHEQIQLSPLEYAFGAEARHKLLSTYFARPATVHIGASLRPDLDERARVAFQADLAALMTSADAANVSFGYNDTSIDGTRRAGGTVQLATDGSLRAMVSAHDLQIGWAGYALASVDPELETSRLIPVNGQSWNDAGRLPLHSALGRGMESSFTHRYTALPLEHQLQGGASSLSASAAAGRPRIKAAAPLSEVGLRYSAPDRRFGLGVHASPFDPYPAKVWAVGTYGGGLTAGVQLSGSAAAMLAAAHARAAAQPLAALGIAAQAPPPESVVPLSSASGASAFSGLSGLRLSDLDLDAAVSLSQEPSFELALSLDGARKELVAGYLHSMTLRRRVANPLAPRHVRGIYNYVDIGFELRRSLLPPYPSSLALGGACQLNKNVLLKARLGSRDVAGSLALKSWWDPATTLCVTASVDRRTGVPAIGCFLALEKGGAVEYRRAVEGAQSPTPNLPLRAAPQLNAQVAQRVEPDPFAPPPRRV